MGLAVLKARTNEWDHDNDQESPLHDNQYDQHQNEEDINENIDNHEHFVQNGKNPQCKVTPGSFPPSRIISVTLFFPPFATFANIMDDIHKRPICSLGQ